MAEGGGGDGVFGGMRVALEVKDGIILGQLNPMSRITPLSQKCDTLIPQLQKI